MDTQSREAAEAFVEKVAASRSGYGPKDTETAKGRAEAAQEARALGAGELLRGGLDPKRLDALAAEHSKTRRKRADAAEERAVEASGAAARRLAELTPPLTALPAEPMNVIIDRVTFIRSFAGAGAVIDSEIGSLDSWARYKFAKSAGATAERGVGRLSFFTLWRNPRTTPVVVTAGARLSVNARLSVDAEWNGVADWFISGSKALGTVRARTTVWAMWNSAISAVVHDRVLADAGAKGGFFGEDDAASIEFNEFLSASAFVVPAQEFILIEVELLTEWLLEDGSLKLDAESGSFKVSVPHLILTLT
jgi:hypothetical protein